jgi:diguanylate cyclase (GGDEF)-like protein
MVSVRGGDPTGAGGGPAGGGGSGAVGGEGDTLPKRVLEEILAIQIARGKTHLFVLALADVDGSHRLVERYGPEAATAAVERIEAEFARRRFPGQVTFRYGPDEVGAFIPGATVEEAFAVIDELRRAIKNQTYTVRAGLSGFPRDAADPTDLIRKAEDALHRAGKDGGDRVCLAAEGSMTLKSNYYTEGQLERLAALARREGRTEASLLREALDDVLRKYDR